MSAWQLASSVIPYLALSYLAWRLLDVSHWMALAVCIPAAGLLIRIFIIAHDCGHGSFFRSRRANEFWGRITSTMAFLPFHAWRSHHAFHHAGSGDLDRRGVGDIHLMTVEEYIAAGRWKRLGYRLYRNPLVMFGLGPVYIFLVSYRFWGKGASRDFRLSVLLTNVALAVAAALVVTTFGWEMLLFVQLPVVLISGSAGVWLFYVQHHFEGVSRVRQENWDYVEQAIGGSSYYRLPRILQWFTGNIGFHHVHHLGTRIPNYSLEKCHNEVDLFHRVRPLSLLGSRKCLRFRLWDEESGRMVSFGQVRSLLRQRSDLGRANGLG